MPIDRIDVRRLVEDIRLLIVDCTNSKKLLRARWSRPMAEEQRRLARLRRTLTERFVLLTASRSRLHVVRPPRHVDAAAWDAAAYNETIARRLQPEYALPQAGRPA